MRSRRQVCRWCGIGAALAVLGWAGGLATAASRELVLWDVASPDRDPPRFETFRRFEQANPGYKVTFQGFTFAEMRDKLISAAMGGIAPDVVRYSFASEFAALNLLESLDPYMGRSREIRRDAFHPITLGPIREMNGRFWGIPFNLELYVVFYNVDHWQRAGLGGAPQTWEELAAYAKKLTRSSGTGQTEVYGLQPTTYIPFIANNEAPPLAEPNDYGAVKANFAHPRVIEAFSYLRELNELGVSTGIQGGSGLFASGQVAMLVHQSSEAHNFRPQVFPDFRFGAFLVPARNGGEPVISGHGQDAVMITKMARDKEAAWRLAEAYASRDAVARLWSVGKYGMLPPYRDLLTRPPVVPAYEPWHNDPYLRSLALLSRQPNFRPMDVTFWHPERTRIVQIINAAISQINTGKASVRTALEEANRQVESVLTQFEAARKVQK